MVVSPIATVTRGLTTQQINDLLDASDPEHYLDPDGYQGDWVIKRTEFYFHEKVMLLDYSAPNVYQSRSAWEQEADGAMRHLQADSGSRRRAAPQRGVRWIWDKVRERAFNCSETGDEPDCGGDPLEWVNTHPIGYIGADNKGTDQLLHPPGKRNNDSHGNYPFPGLYQQVGPLGAAENISKHTEIVPERWMGEAIETDPTVRTLSDALDVLGHDEVACPTRRRAHVSTLLHGTSGPRPGDCVAARRAVRTRGAAR